MRRGVRGSAGIGGEVRVQWAGISAEVVAGRTGHWVDCRDGGRTPRGVQLSVRLGSVMQPRLQCLVV